MKFSYNYNNNKSHKHHLTHKFYRHPFHHHLNMFLPLPNNPNEPPRKSPSRGFGDQDSEGTTKVLFNFEPSHVMFDSDDEQYSNLPSLVVPSVYGPDLHSTITDVSVRYHSQPKPKEPSVGKILKKFELDSQRCLRAPM